MCTPTFSILFYYISQCLMIKSLFVITLDPKVLYMPIHFQVHLLVHPASHPQISSTYWCFSVMREWMGLSSIIHPYSSHIPINSPYFWHQPGRAQAFLRSLPLGQDGLSPRQWRLERARGAWSLVWFGELTIAINILMVILMIIVMFIINQWL